MLRLYNSVIPLLVFCWLSYFLPLLPFHHQTIFYTPYKVWMDDS